MLNVKTRRLYVKIVNADIDVKTAYVDLRRFGLKGSATKTVITGNPDDENNYDAQPIAPQRETLKAKKRFEIDVPPYTMIMFEYQL